MSLGCFNLVGAELSDSVAGESWEAGKPSLVCCIEPGCDWRGAHCHVIEVDQTRNGFDCDTVCFTEWLFAEWCLCCGSLGFLDGGVPPVKFVRVAVIA